MQKHSSTRFQTRSSGGSPGPEINRVNPRFPPVVRRNRTARRAQPLFVPVAQLVILFDLFHDDGRKASFFSLVPPAPPMRSSSSGRPRHRLLVRPRAHGTKDAALIQSPGAMGKLVAHWSGRCARLIDRAQKRLYFSLNESCQRRRNMPCAARALSAGRLCACVCVFLLSFSPLPSCSAFPPRFHSLSPHKPKDAFLTADRHSLAVLST